MAARTAGIDRNEETASLSTGVRYFRPVFLTASLFGHHFIIGMSLSSSTVLLIYCFDKNDV